MQAIAFLRNASLAAAWRAWGHFKAQQQQKAATLAWAVECLQTARLASYFATWKEEHAIAVEERTLLAHAVGLLRNHSLAVAWSAWHENVILLQTDRELLARCDLIYLQSIILNRVTCLPITTKPSTLQTGLYEPAFQINWLASVWQGDALL